MNREAPHEATDDAGEPRGLPTSRWHGWIAAGLFLVVAVVSVRRLPPLELHWGWLGLAVVALLVTTSLIAAEYRVAGALLEKRLAWGEAFRVTILSSAANLLPVPGGLVIRTEALRRKGSRWQAALGSNVVMGLGWLGVALVVAGILLVGQTGPFVVVAFLGSGLVVLIVLVLAVARMGGRKRVVRSTAAVLSVEVLYVAVSAFRLFAILRGVGIGVTYAQAAALTVASALASGVGFFPGGLGLRELLAGGIAPLVGLAPATGAFAGVVDRIIGVTIRGLLAGVLWTFGDLRGD